MKPYYSVTVGGIPAKVHVVDNSTGQELKGIQYLKYEASVGSFPTLTLVLVNVSIDSGEVPGELVTFIPFKNLES